MSQNTPNTAERIRQVISNENLTIRAFERAIGCTDGVISKCLRAGSDVSVKVLSSIVERFPQYSASWLLTGSGQMLNNAGDGNININASTLNDSPISEGNSDTIKAAIDEIGEQRKVTQKCQEQIDKLIDIIQKSRP